MVVNVQGSRATQKTSEDMTAAPASKRYISRTSGHSENVSNQVPVTRSDNAAATPGRLVSDSEEDEQIVKMGIERKGLEIGLAKMQLKRNVDGLWEEGT